MAGIYADSSLICSVYEFALIRYRNSDSKYNKKLGCINIWGDILTGEDNSISFENLDNARKNI